MYSRLMSNLTLLLCVSSLLGCESRQMQVDLATQRSTVDTLRSQLARTEELLESATTQLRVAAEQAETFKSEIKESEIARQAAQNAQDKMAVEVKQLKTQLSSATAELREIARKEWESASELSPVGTWTFTAVQPPSLYSKNDRRETVPYRLIVFNDNQWMMQWWGGGAWQSWGGLLKGVIGGKRDVKTSRCRPTAVGSYLLPYEDYEAYKPEMPARPRGQTAQNPIGYTMYEAEVERAVDIQMTLYVESRERARLVNGPGRDVDLERVGSDWAPSAESD